MGRLAILVGYVKAIECSLMLNKTLWGEGKSKVGTLERVINVG
jgi:hypothetical protein